MFTLYNVISSDGFIARQDGSEDFIPDDLNLWQKFLDLCLEHKTLMVGKNTYNTIQEYGQTLIDSLEKLPINKIVVSSDKNLILKNGYVLVNSPEEAIFQAPNALVSSGPGLNNYLIEHGLVGNIIQYRLPNSIGDGIKPFIQNNLSSKINIKVYDWKA